MSCYISGGVTLTNCSIGVGGIKKIYIVGGTDDGLTGFTFDVNDSITGATSETGSSLYGFNLKRGVNSLTQGITKSYENGTLVFDQELTVVLFKYDVDKRNLIYLLAKNDDLQIVAIDGNDTKYLLGRVNGMSLGGSIVSGTALTDRNGFELTFTGQEPAPADIIVGDLDTVFSDLTVVE